MNVSLVKKSSLLFGILFMALVCCVVLLPRAAYADPAVSYVVDRAGRGDYTKIQDAVDAVQKASVSSSTNFTINLNTGNYPEVIQIQQQEYKNLVIQSSQGKDAIIEGRIMVDGMGRSDGAEKLDIKRLTIIDQAPSDPDAACILTNNVGGDPHASAVHNLTATNCTFDSNAKAHSVLNTTGVRIRPGTEGDAYGVVLQGCTATENVYSMMEGLGRVEDVRISNCEVDGTRGVSLRPTGTCMINGCTFDAVEYAIKLGHEAAGSELADCSVIIDYCELSVAEADRPTDSGVIVTEGDAPNDYTVSKCVLVNEAESGVVWNNLNKKQAKDMDFLLKENYWGSDGCGEDSFAGMDSGALADIFNAGNDFVVYLTYDANGGSFPDGKTIQADQLGKVTITNAGLKTGKTLLTSTLLEKPSFADHVFEGWYTAKDGGDEVTDSAGSVSIAKDTVLYAHWSAAQVPSLETAVDTLHLATDVVLPQDQLLEVVGAQAFDSSGEELPRSSIEVLGGESMQFDAIGWTQGASFTIPLSVTKDDVTKTVDVEVQVVPEGITLEPVADYGAAGLLAPPEGLEWSEAPGGQYVLKTIDVSDASHVNAVQSLARYGFLPTDENTLFELLGMTTVLVILSVFAVFLAQKRIHTRS